MLGKVKNSSQGGSDSILLALVDMGCVFRPVSVTSPDYGRSIHLVEVVR